MACVGCTSYKPWGSPSSSVSAQFAGTAFIGNMLTFATSAFRHSKQNFATPVQAPKRHKVSSRPSLASVVNANTTRARGNTTQQSEVSAVLLSAELAGEPQSERMDTELVDREFAIDIVHQEIEQRDRKRKSVQDEEAATALFMR